MTRSSPTSRNRVVPWATAAATARMGTSSSEGISAPRRSVPCSRAGVAGQRPGARSPASSTSMVAPIRRSTPTNPSRSAPRLMVGHGDQAAGDDGAPTTQKAAWEGRRARCRPRLPGHCAGPGPPGPRPSSSTGDVGPGRGQHLLGVGPGGHRLVHHRLPVGGEPGQQDGRLDLGAGHGRRVLDAPQRPAGDGDRGEAAVALLPSTRAPIRVSGSATRSMGRLRSEASPVRVVVPARVAATPARRRMPVPELPRSSAACGAAQA